MLLYVTAVMGSRTPALVEVMGLLLVTQLWSALPLLLDVPVRAEGENVRAGAA